MLKGKIGGRRRSPQIITQSPGNVSARSMILRRSSLHDCPGDCFADKAGLQRYARVAKQKRAFRMKGSFGISEMNYPS